MIEDNIWIYPTVITINDMWIWFAIKIDNVWESWSFEYKLFSYYAFEAGYTNKYLRDKLYEYHVFEARYMIIMTLGQVIWILCLLEHVNAELSFRLLIWGFEKSLQLDPIRTYHWRTKVICNWSPPPYAYNKVRTRSINHNEVD
jgi:hypothetical protein